jgi:putative phage-type endonuclease
MLPQQNTPEWLEFRRNRIGASDAVIIMGDSPWTTPNALWMDKMGLTESKPMNTAMKRGHDIEEDARDWFELQMFVPIYPQVCLHHDIDWMMASCDGLSADGKTLVEIKCPGKVDHLLAKKGQVPPKYKAQLQHQMEVCQLSSMYYLSFDGTEGIIIPVERDDGYISKMLVNEFDFWECLQTFRAPELCDRDFDCREDDLWIHAASEWSEVRSKLQVLQDREDELRRALCDMSNGVNTCGGGVKLSKVVRKGNIDYKNIPELEDVDLEQYRRPTTQFFKITNLPY